MADRTLTITTRVKDLASKDLRKMGDTGKRAGQSIALGFIKAQLSLAALRSAMRFFIRGFKDLTFGIAEHVDAQAKMSKQLGVNVELLSGLSLGAELSGTSLRGLGTGIRNLVRNANDMAAGVGEAKDAFLELGVNVLDSSGELKSTEELLKDVAEALSNVQNETKKVALAQEIFGSRVGGQLIPLLNEGREGIRAYMEEARRLGIVLTEEQARRFEDFRDSVTRLKFAFTGLKIVVGETILPIVQDGIEKLTTSISDNRDEIAEWSRQAIEDIKDFASATKEVLSDLTEVIGGVARGLTAVGNAILSAAEAVGVFTSDPSYMAGIESVRALKGGAGIGAGSIAGAGAAAAAGANFGATVTAPETVVTADSLGFLELLKTGGKEAIEQLDTIRTFAENVGSTLATSLTQGFSTFFDSIIFGAASAGDAFKAFMRDVLRSLAQLATQQLALQALGALFGAANIGFGAANPIFQQGGAGTTTGLSNALRTDQGARSLIRNAAGTGLYQ